MQMVSTLAPGQEKSTWKQDKRQAQENTQSVQRRGAQLVVVVVVVMMVVVVVAAPRSAHVSERN